MFMKLNWEWLCGNFGLGLVVGVCCGVGGLLIVFSMFCIRNVS